VEEEPSFSIWRDGILRDWKKVSGLFGLPAQTLFFGGGTPSLVPVPILRDLIQQLPIGEGAEISMEANPEDISQPVLDGYLGAGINRLSLGIQTFSARQGRLLRRIQPKTDVHALLHQVANAGFRSWSFDLIFGVPHQTMTELNRDLNALLDHGPPHVSLYGLTFHEGTPFAAALASGRLQALDESLWLEMVQTIHERLVAAGYERYELSNYALPGHRSKHNEGIWRGGYYAGLGPGAHGFLPDGRRTTQADEWDAWLGTQSMKIETTTVHQRAMDAVLTWIRHCDGIDQAFLRDLGYQIPLNTLSTMVQEEWISVEGDQIRLGPAGFPLADAVTLALISRMVKLVSEVSTE